MPSRRPPADGVEFDALPFRVTRAQLKTLFVRTTEQLCPEIWADLFEHAYPDSKFNPYDWKAYDEWAQRHALTPPGDIEDRSFAYADWLRVFAWSLRKTRRLPRQLHFEHLALRDKRKGDRLLPHRRAQDAVRIFIQWQVLSWKWPDIVKAEALREKPVRTVSQARGLALGVAHSLSFEFRRAKAGRPSTGRRRFQSAKARHSRVRAEPIDRRLRKRQPPTAEQLDWLRPRVPILRAAIEEILRSYDEDDEGADLALLLADWSDKPVKLLREVVKLRGRRAPISLIMPCVVAAKFDRGRPFGQRALKLLHSN
jgi:hypothetical protein